MSVYEDEFLAEDLQCLEIWLALCRGGSKDSQESCETYQSDAGIELIN